MEVGISCSVERRPPTVTVQLYNLIDIEMLEQVSNPYYTKDIVPCCFRFQHAWRWIGAVSIGIFRGGAPRSREIPHGPLLEARRLGWFVQLLLRPPWLASL